jgi:hypothetical protein
MRMSTGSQGIWWFLHFGASTFVTARVLTRMVQNTIRTRFTFRRSEINEALFGDNIICPTWGPEPMDRELFDSRVTQARNKILLRTLNDGSLKIRLKVKAHGDAVQWPLDLQASGHSPQDDYVDRLHRITQEVISAHDSMRSVELYLSRFAFAKQGVRASVYIQFHVGNYYNEGYILSERMKVFAKVLQREFRKDPKGPSNLDVQINTVIEAVQKLFKPLVETRGAHVHQQRYNDAELARLALLELLAEAKPDIFLKHLIRSRRLARQNALEFVKTVNKGLAKRLDQFFKLFEGLVFRNDGSLRIPSHLT